MKIFSFERARLSVHGIASKALSGRPFCDNYLALMCERVTRKTRPLLPLGRSCEPSQLNGIGFKPSSSAAAEQFRLCAAALNRFMSGPAGFTNVSSPDGEGFPQFPEGTLMQIQTGFPFGIKSADAVILVEANG